MKKLLSHLGILIFATSCELVVDVDIPFEGKQVTANAFFNPDSLWSVQLNFNRDVLDDAPFGEVTDAQVVIYEAGTPIDTLANFGYGQFRGDGKTPEPGKTYSLSVRTPGYGDDLHAISDIPFPTPITNVDIYESASNSMLKVTLTDDGGESNYYELYVTLDYEYYNYIEQRIEYVGQRLQLTSEDPFIQNDDDSYTNSIVFKDALFNGKAPTLTFRLSGGGISYAGGVSVTLRSLSEDAYNYLRTVHLNDMTSGDPFAQPINVYNNIQNGFGIFAGYSASAYTKSSLKPVIVNVDPMAGKAGDHIIITGENFIPEDQVSVSFQATQYWIAGQLVEVTPTRIEVIVPPAAVTGRIVVRNGRIAVSDEDFVVTD